jgi:hypothetical protein
VLGMLNDEAAGVTTKDNLDFSREKSAILLQEGTFRN